MYVGGLVYLHDDNVSIGIILGYIRRFECFLFHFVGGGIKKKQQFWHFLFISMNEFIFIAFIIWAEKNNSFKPAKTESPICKCTWIIA